MAGIRTELRRRTRERAAAGPQVRHVQVRRNVRIAPRFRRVTVGGTELVGFSCGTLPADAFKAFLPPPDDRTAPPCVRAYTVRRYDPQALEIDFDVVLHESSPGSVWAENAQPGDEIGVVGPRHDFYASPEADWHLLVADETGLPAVAAILESLPDDVPVRALIEVTDEDDELPLRRRPGIRVHWLHRRDREPGTTDLLESAVRGLDWLGGQVQAWVAAESGAARAVRAYLRERGVSREATQISGYWRRGLDNRQLDDVAARRYVRAEQLGCDVDDLPVEDDTAA